MLANVSVRRESSPTCICCFTISKGVLFTYKLPHSISKNLGPTASQEVYYVLVYPVTIVLSDKSLGRLVSEEVTESRRERYYHVRAETGVKALFLNGLLDVLSFAETRLYSGLECVDGKAYDID